VVLAEAAVELLHNFTLVHDDIQDASPTRRTARSFSVLPGSFFSAVSYKQ
jgi:geranylgeranyl pyrophosphate synthase